MRKIAALVAALIVLALGLTACGGGSETSASTSTPPAATPAGGGSVVASAPAAPDLSKTETGYPAPFPKISEVVPRSVAENISLKQPMLIVFLDSTQKTTDDEKAEIGAVMKKYRGLIELVSFDMAKGVDSGAKSEEASAALQAALFAEELKIGFTPYILIVDKRATITFRSSGYIDRGILEREVLRATE